MLEARDLQSGYGDVTVLNDISFTVENEIFAVLGANGAGKSTLLRTLAKLIQPTGGQISLEGSNVTNTPAYQLAAMGLAFVPQEQNVFPDLSVAENLSIGGMIGDRSFEDRKAEILDLFPRLADRQQQAAGSLSGGEGQMLAVGRALMQDPKIILLDEPSAGLAPVFVDTLFEKITEIRRDKNVTVVLAEQNAVKTLEIADRVMVLSLGTVHLLKEAKELELRELMDAYHI